MLVKLLNEFLFYSGILEPFVILSFELNGRRFPNCILNFVGIV